MAIADDLDHPRDTVTYELVDDAGGLFAIDGETGVVTLSGEAEYESRSSHEITVLAASSGNTSTNTASK